jgi:hypothetical protein
MHMLWGHDLLGRLAADAHVQAVILGIVPLDLKFSQIVIIEQFCEGADKSHIGVMSVFGHFVPQPV